MVDIGAGIFKSMIYTESLPTLPIGGTGISRLAQWAVVPLIAHWWALRPLATHPRPEKECLS